MRPVSVGSLALVVALAAAVVAPLEAQRPRNVLDLLRADGEVRPELSVSLALETAFRDSIVSLARAQVGKRYRFGAESGKRGFDCSGLVRFVLAALDLPLEVPRTAAQQARVGDALPADTAHLRPGDLLIFGRAGRVTHIGIYVGGGRFVHASSVAGKVIESPVHRAPHPRIAPLKGARRLTLLPGWLGDSALAPETSG